MPPGKIVTTRKIKTYKVRENPGLIPIVIIGAGGHASVISDIIKKQGRYCIIGYTVPGEQPSAASWGYKYLGNDTVLPELLQDGIKLAALGVGGTGNNRPRSKLYEQIRALGFSFPVLSHPAAIVSGNVFLGDGTVIAPGAVVNPGVETGVNVIINSGSMIEHVTSIGDHVHVSPGAIICGGVRIGRLAHVGAGAVVIQGVSIGEGAVVGAGAVVLHDVESWTVVAGNPARGIRKIEE